MLSESFFFQNFNTEEHSTGMLGLCMSVHLFFQSLITLTYNVIVLDKKKKMGKVGFLIFNAI